ncbi:hypothetical protein GCM10020367_40100 [Streptomyces sannanensis]|uniref:DUF2029 domain-containing protein n=1 Tax=Streptomyces sannanensis TaxID=285536 RepID=A0ABP6SEE3_9ACTN
MRERGAEAAAPGAGRRARLRLRLRVPVVATAVVIPLYAVWATLLATGAGDLSAQLAWAGFTARHPGSAYNLSWYGGAHPANYSLLTPYLMAWFGVRTVTVAAGLAGSWLLALLFVRAGVRRPLWPAVLGSLALWCNVASGRTTFAVGVAIGLGACLCALGGRSGERAVLTWALLTSVSSALATMASPVAGLFLAVVGAACALDRQWRPAAALLLPPALVVAATTWFFPFHGEQPMAPGKLWMPLVACAALVLAAPRAWRTLRFGAAVYAVGVVLTFLVASPVGTNVERLVGLAGPPVLLAAVLASPGVTGRDRVRRAVLAAVLVVSTGWLVDKTDDDLRVSTTVPAWADHTAGVTAELRRLGADRTRVEVVPARNHREASVLAPYVHMARGWNRQLDVERGRLFYDGTLTPDTYRAWLDRWAVGYVVLHDGRPDGPAEGEAAIVRSRPEWLEPVWRDAHWTVLRVRDAVPLVDRPARVVAADQASLRIRLDRPGSVTVRIAYSPWLRADGGASVGRDGEFVRLTAPGAGEYRLDAPYFTGRLP